MADISLDQLAAEITRVVREYTEDVSEAVEKKVGEVADKVLAEVAVSAPKRTGGYAQGFKVTKQDSGGKARRVIWNKKDYRRVHLLEFGHAKRNGGRVQAIPHLRPAYDKHADGLTDDIKRIIQNGGGT
ncbi:HK97 gp10 family phage protein [Brevibacillus choshinensis]|uniref:HK97 gp10 family phage protein n=1 Tax=Brevibacillus choshinensis TaxID=54911 RepID=A0ABX7FL08_BRECH|nr:HK97 gp10 family phage protein [Brevibacillus choshinensis]QRG66934.1 HK97 gp10 family phage protein [Brevibacillus choshinensis]